MDWDVVLVVLNDESAKSTAQVQKRGDQPSFENKGGRHEKTKTNRELFLPKKKPPKPPPKKQLYLVLFVVEFDAEVFHVIQQDV